LNHTVNAEIKALSTMLSWARRTDLVLDNPVERIDPLPEREVDLKKRRHPLTDMEIDRVLEECRKLDIGRAVPQAPMFELMLVTALRWGHIAALQPTDLHGATLIVRCEADKGGRSTEIPLSAELARSLDLPFKTPRGRPYALNIGFARRLLRELCLRAKIPLRDERGRTIDLHCLRKSSLSRYARRGVTPAALQRLANHADPRTTLRHYVELSLDELRKSLRPHWTMQKPLSQVKSLEAK
jgi:integrase